MPTTREEALETLRALKPAPVFIQSCFEKRLQERRARYLSRVAARG